MGSTQAEFHTYCWRRDVDTSRGWQCCTQESSGMSIEDSDQAFCTAMDMQSRITPVSRLDVELSWACGTKLPQTVMRDFRFARSSPSAALGFVLSVNTHFPGMVLQLLGTSESFIVSNVWLPVKLFIFFLKDKSPLLTLITCSPAEGTEVEDDCLCRAPLTVLRTWDHASERGVSWTLPPP